MIDVSGVLEETPPDLGEMNRARRAVEQAHAKSILQGSNRARERRWRAVQRGCCLREALGLCNGDELAQLVKAIHRQFRKPE